MRRLIPLLSLLALGWVGCASTSDPTGLSSAASTLEDDTLPSCDGRTVLPADVTLEDNRAGDGVILRHQGVALCTSPSVDQLSHAGILIGHGLFVGQKLVVSGDRAASDPMPADGTREGASDPMPATADDSNSDPMPARAARLHAVNPL